MEELADSGKATAAERHVAIVILNYNSDSDLMVSAPQLAAQEDVRTSLIIVDNASKPNSVERIKSWLKDWRPDAITGTQTKILEWILANDKCARLPGRVFFVTHQENHGYSAGNNIGIRLAEALGTDAVLVANPDIRIENPAYLAVLTAQLFWDDRNYIAASRILGLDGKNQNPIREASFWEELLWPRHYLMSKLGKASYVVPIRSDQPFFADKVSGCCLLLRMSFLQATNYLDENVFLYCEEPILAARVRALKGRLVFVPAVHAIHAHRKSEKDGTGKRMLVFIRSRQYYLETYSGYSQWQLRLLRLSYGALAVINTLRKLTVG